MNGLDADLMLKKNFQYRDQEARMNIPAAAWRNVDEVAKAWQLGAVGNCKVWNVFCPRMRAADERMLVLLSVSLSTGEPLRSAPQVEAPLRVAPKEQEPREA